MSAVIPKSVDQLLPALKDVVAVLDAAERLLHDRGASQLGRRIIGDAQELLGLAIELLEENGLSRSPLVAPGGVDGLRALPAGRVLQI